MISRLAFRAPSRLLHHIYRPPIGPAASTFRHTSMPLKRSARGDAVSPPPAKRKVATTTTSKAVASFFTPTSQKEPEKVTFQVVQKTLIVGRVTDAATSERPKPLKIAAFDFDDTLIKTKSGNVFARGADDWQWWHGTVPTKLRQLYDDGFALVVVSNQNGISLNPEKGVDRKRYNNFKEKVTACLLTLDRPMTVYAATERDTYRKPRTGIWDQIMRDYSVESSEVDLEHSIFVGDAAGRAGDKAAHIRSDHSCSDRDLAENVGIHFYTPEEYFLGEETKPFVRNFEPKQYIGPARDSPTGQTPIVFSKKNDLDIVLFCGSPGSGKSTFYWTYLELLGYARVNQDILKTRDKCVKFATERLKDKTSVVVDNTNADMETRAVWVKLAQSLEIPIRLVHFTAPAKLCEHNDTVRALSSGAMNRENRVMLPRAAFVGFASRYREPKMAEGFQDMMQVHFAFRGTDEEQQLWSRYWIS